jgi:hypothetical protein
MNIELYINRQLCDTGNPRSFSLRLKRQLYNPAELNAKDAQASYSLTLPASPANNRIFGFANTEEVQGKFGSLYGAQLLVNGIKVFEGKFRLSEINAHSYKGNLGVPAPVTAKTVFGDKKMNEMGSWELPLSGLPPMDFISQTNRSDLPPCIFPLVLYGLLPKVRGEGGLYSPKELLDETVRFGIEDFPPSANCLQMLKRMFRNAGYNLGGDAFDDERLKALYASYKNPNDYVQEWNWGDLATISAEGSWTMASRATPFSLDGFERRVSQDTDEYGKYFSVNLFDSNRLNIKNLSDTGTNTHFHETSDTYNDGKPYTRKNLQITIPRSGYYKVKLHCSSFRLLPHALDWLVSPGEFTDKETGNKFTYAQQPSDHDNSFAQSRYELQVLRDYGEGDFRNSNVVGCFNRPQFPQEAFAEKDSSDQQFPKYYPVPGNALVVDPGVNPNFVCGLHWGEHGKPGSENREWNPKDSPEYGGNKLAAYYMFIANGFSWDKTFVQKKKILSLYDSSIYTTDGEGNTHRSEGNYYCYGQDGGKSGADWLAGLVKARYGALDYSENGKGGKHPNFAAQTEGDNGQYLNMEGSGQVECIIWLDKGERLTLAIAGDIASRYHSSASFIPLIEQVDFSLHVEPYRTDILWGNFDNSGNADLANLRKWNGEPTFRKGNIDLSAFLPSEQKIDDWIENFCKAFNLNLVHEGGANFRMDVKHKKALALSGRNINLDSRANVQYRTNLPLALPEKYQLGFTVDTDEEGYYRSITETNSDTGAKLLDKGYKGGGTFFTGNIGGGEMNQSSGFSYCWYKRLTVSSGGIPRTLLVPVISGKEVWERPENEDYQEMMQKQYFDKAQRFWFKGGTFGLPLGNPTIGAGPPQKRIEAALVQNEHPRLGLSLNYENRPGSILRQYFLLLDNSYFYTEVECLLSPQEYRDLDILQAVFNGSLYHVASVDGYDPLCRAPAKLKLLRRLRKWL